MRPRPRYSRDAAPRTKNNAPRKNTITHQPNVGPNQNSTPSGLGATSPAPYGALPSWKRPPADALGLFKDSLMKEAVALLGKFVDQLLVQVAGLGFLNEKLQAATFSGACAL